MESPMCKLFSVGLVLVLATQAVSTTTVHRRQRTDPKESPRATSEYDWLCPKVLCQPLPSGCQRVEFFVFEHSYEINGKQVEIRCESCQYCIDAPYRRRRSRRETGLGAATRLAQICARVQCPFVPSECEHVLPVQLLVHSEPCRRCPACFDNTIGFSDVRHYNRQTTM
ncbi:hypothetical protein NP493_55g03015 [Ridgeia piscesae]|uniref:Uncharacterized protein n=1 Tax=Ridgeia piscesae TaxID=27915 RepID=A0AAD9PAI8_RIDPI|nr:hypothetical protein NP493_55g03015 [Ridgeia piscesae]